VAPASEGDARREPPRKHMVGRLASFLGNCTIATGDDEDDMALVGTSPTATDDDQVCLERHISNFSTTRRAALDAITEEAPEGQTRSSIDELMTFFGEVRVLLRTLRQDLVRGNRVALHDGAEKLERKATRLGAKSLARKAAALKGQTFAVIRSVHIDELEQQLDASEAIYRSCRLRV
jgi:hypothetical protein